MQEYRNLELERRDDGIAVVWLDVEESSVNLMREDLGRELGQAVSEVESTAKGLVIASRKRDFLVGADLRRLRECDTSERVAELARDAQQTFQRIADSTLPTVAAVAGSCIGGGLELALACDAIIAADDRATELGSPEVQLGLIPGAGGTQRLPQRVDLVNAVQMMITGKSVDVQRAKRIGLIDEAAARPIVVDVAARHALDLAKSRAGRSQPHWSARLRGFFDTDNLEGKLTDNPVGRKLVLDRARRESRTRTRGNYPAPERLLDVIETGFSEGFEAGLEAERSAFGELAMTAEARELLRLFFLRRKYKKQSGVDSGEAEPQAVQRVGVLGAGLMGAGIAYVTAEKAGLRVRLADRDDASLRAGMREIRKRVDGQVRRNKLTKLEADELMLRLGPNTDHSGFSGCDVVIEAVFEDLDLKRKLLERVHDLTSGRAVFASNTSALPIADIAEATTKPEQVVGMHYFSPVEKMPLLEVVRGAKTSDEAVRTAVELGKQQGKTVIVVHDGPGFYTSRILAPLIAEAFTLVMEGISIERVDQAVQDFGFPMGPIRLADEVGLDVCQKIARTLNRAFGERMPTQPSFDRLIEEGRRGKKAGEGVYVERGSKRVVDPAVYDALGVRPNGISMRSEDIAQRCTLRMINEAAYCYGEGILRSADDGDIAAVLGLGFPPFLGGPFRCIETQGAASLAAKLSALREEHGPRFSPAPLLSTMSEGNERRTFSSGTAPKPGSTPSHAASGAA